MAKHLGCQSAYLYQILKGKGDLTDDQAFKVTTFLGFNKAEQNFFLLNVRLAKAGSLELRNFLTEEISKILQEEQDLKNKADSVLAEKNEDVWNYYFSGSLPSLIHIMTSSNAFRTSENIAKYLQISNKLANDHLKSLNEFGFVISKAGKWYHASPSIHIPKQSHHNINLQAMRRSQVLDSIFKANSDSIHFSSLFTIDKHSLESLRLMISEFIQNAQKAIHRGGTDELHIMCLDFFEPRL